MKLYQVPRHSKVRIVEPHPSVPPAHRELFGGDVLTFDHIDGMYSFCYDEAGKIVHPAAWAEVEVIEDEAR